MSLASFQTEAEARNFMASYPNASDEILTVSYVHAGQKQLTPKQIMGSKRKYGSDEKCKHCGAKTMTGATRCIHCGRDKHESALADAWSKTTNVAVEVMLYIFFIGLGILLVLGFLQSFSDPEPLDFRQERQFDRFGY